jgi:hypothetical protein
MLECGLSECNEHIQRAMLGGGIIGALFGYLIAQAVRLLIHLNSKIKL